MPPWSWSNKSEPAVATPVAEVQSGPMLETITTNQEVQSSADPEMAELGKLLADVANPVYKGRVQKTPQPESTTYTAPVITRTSPEKVAPKTTTIEQIPTVAAPTLTKPAVIAPEPVVLKTEPEEPVPSTVVTQPIVAKTTEPRVAPEPVVQAIQEPIVMAEPASDEPIITVRPPAQPEPEPIVQASPPVIVPENTLAPAEPAPGTGQIVTAKPPVQPTVELQPSEPELSAMVPTVSTVTLPSGKNHMAKPWERLGDSASAARNFYTYAPTLSNY